jgi:hypothetical protein
MNPTTDICRVCGEPVSLHDSAIQFENCRPAHKSCLLGERPASHATNFRNALLAIKARINGEWDHPALMEIGPLHHDQLTDVLSIIERALESQPTTTKET